MTTLYATVKVRAPARTDVCGGRGVDARRSVRTTRHGVDEED